MDIVFQISALSVIAAICCCIIKSHVGAITITLSTAACVIILLASFQFLKPILEIIDRIQKMTNLSAITIAPLMKVVGVGILTQIAGAICDDAGETTLHRTVEIAGMVLSLYLSLPLLSAVLDLLEEFLNK